ncbi:MAG: spermidine/putrescine ABC transporter substrate-binding protein [Oscillospiraceae bacterium]|nr:spermidine/putrescine ABC transporter substrate-binding protein [Oscillospiraceae bacterium]
MTINVYNWGVCIAEGSDGVPGTNERFTAETGIKVNYSTFQSNEEMYAKIAGEGACFDVIVPSDYMIAKLIENDMILKLDFKNIPNYSEISDKHKFLDFDPWNEYSVPYLWGVVGIFYNEKYVKEKKISWDILWNPEYKGKILVFDNLRDAFAISLIRLKYNINSSNPEHWQKAMIELKKQRPLLQNYMMDQIFDKLFGEEAYVASYYCDCGNPNEMFGNPFIHFAVPSEGTNKFVDSMCIPKTCKHKKEAEMYINFMCKTDISTANAISSCYLSPNIYADEILSNNPQYQYCSSIENTQVLTNLPHEISELADKLWVDVKANGTSTLLEKIIFIDTFVIFVLIYPLILLRKRRS